MSRSSILLINMSFFYANILMFSLLNFYGLISGHGGDASNSSFIIPELLLINGFCISL